MIQKEDITGVILAGGQGRRMQGKDKGLLSIHGKPLIEHLISMLLPQVGSLVINANRNHTHYEKYGYPIISDTINDFQGPLAGFASAMQAVDTPYIATIPCDAPLLAKDSLEKLIKTLNNDTQAELAVAFDGERLQPVYALIPISLLSSLEHFLSQGGRKIDLWYAQHAMVKADFSDNATMFHNLNTPEQYNAYHTKK